MSAKPSNAKEALLAELLGDVQTLLVRLEQADQSARATASAVTDATAQYRSQVDELVTKLRAETASIVLKTTEHAAQSLVGQQQATLQKAATQAMQQAITAQVLKHTRRDRQCHDPCTGWTAKLARRKLRQPARVLTRSVTDSAARPAPGRRKREGCAGLRSSPRRG